MSNYQDYLQPDETDLWNLPILRRYHSLVADTLLPTPISIKVGMLCLPSCESEWLLTVEEKTDYRQHTIKGEYVLRLATAEPQIWKILSKTPKGQNLNVTPQINTASVDAKTVEVLCKVWHSMLRQTQRKPSNLVCFDGVNYHFMTWHNELLVGQTHSPDENSRAGQLVAIGESLRELVLSDEAPNPIQEHHLLQLASNLQKRLSDAARFQSLFTDMK